MSLLWSLTRDNITAELYSFSRSANICCLSFDSIFMAGTVMLCCSISCLRGERNVKMIIGVSGILSRGYYNLYQTLVVKEGHVL